MLHLLQKQHRPLILLVSFILLALGVAYLSFRGMPDVSKEPSVPGSFEPDPITESGMISCLPHRDTSGPTTLECAIGLQTPAGTYFALDASDLAGTPLYQYNTGDPIEVSGTLISRQNLPEDDHLRIYDIAGVIRLTAISGNATEKHTMAGEELSFSRPSDFALAVNQEQVLTKSVIPPCASTFDYCLYYSGNEYEGTNFESAGLRITERNDLSDKAQCLATPPEGYDALAPRIHEESDYATSVFAPVGDAGAGHYATGSLYRLAFNAHCYEFEARIGITQFQNYEPGTIKEFTDADRITLERRLAAVRDSIHFSDSQKRVVFP